MLLPLVLDRSGPLQQQLVDQLRRMIESGAIGAGERMPSTRAFAEQFAISRMTAVLVYERLTVAGLLHTVPAGGTFVGEGPAVQRPEARGDATPLPAESRIDDPDPALFPASRWRALMRDAIGQFGRPVENPGATARQALQGTLAKWLRGTRGIDVAPEQIIIVPGRQQALNILAHMLLGHGKRVAVEAPGDDRAAEIWLDHGARLVQVPIDANGLVTSRLPRTPTALLQVMPGWHYPLGATLAPERRQEVLAWATAMAAHVVEIDRVGDLRYDHHHRPTLMAEDRAGRVCHVGDFGGILRPWLSTGYLVVPPSLAERAEAARATGQGEAGGIWLGVLNEFIESDAYTRHLLRIRRIYGARREALASALQATFPGGQVIGAAAGLTLAWRPPATFADAERLATMARHCGIPASVLSLPIASELAARVPKTLLLGFARLPEVEAGTAVAALARFHAASAGNDDRVAAD